MLDTTDELTDLASWLRILEKVVEQSANMVVIADASQRIHWVNQTYTKVTGWTLGEVQGKRAGEQLQGPLTDKRIRQQLRERLSQGQSVAGVEIVNYRKNGEPYLALLNIEIIRGSQGQVLAYFSIQSDISEKRALEKANVELQHHLQVAQRLARLGRVEVDTGTGMMRWSCEVYDILDLPVDESPKTCESFFAFVSPENHQDFQQRLTRVLQSGEAFDHELPISTRDGRRRWVRCRGVPERQGDRFGPPGTWTIQDITVYRELIEQKRLTNDKLRAMVRERTQHLEEANGSLEAFSHALSHDLKKPVRHMTSYAEIVQESLAAGDIDSAQAYCKKLVTAGTQMRALMDGLLAFSRLGRRSLKPSWVAMADMLCDCVGETAASFPELRFRVGGMETLPRVWADPVLIREVWANLVDNAFKYSAGRDLILLELACATTDEGWTLSLRDNGCGFSPAMQSHIFQMFGRANPDQAVAGDGIGLAMCQRIVLAHGGRIWAESAPGEGSTFFVFLPIATPTPSVGPV
ncbi:PAS domain S-box-containing protein [Hydrogenophaga palleronii]|uniref:histidine kinase n=1 Tax=Hydrogenophaga palleronii TaxID=65655 RepID=A0ABU1WND5_9BURK|nr:ATP-binding protein [Hydrogenophaga palleronii]MDR7150773.1 PAS domain S-box-containing protein [Hydrogenophaga palleronii]